jgi:hypothetical protein
MKSLLFASALLFSAISHAEQNHTQVLLAPLDAAKAGDFDWGVVVKAEPIRQTGGTADRGTLKVDLDLAKFFQEGYAIYSITKLQSADPSSDTLMFVMIRPKK